MPSPVAAATPWRPAPPIDLWAAAGDIEVFLGWTSSTSPNVWCWVECRDASRGQSWQRMLYPGPATSPRPGYLTNGQTHEFRVFSLGVSRESVPSNVVSARPLPPRPARPNLSAFGFDWSDNGCYAPILGANPTLVSSTEPAPVTTSTMATIGSWASTTRTGAPGPTHVVRRHEERLLRPTLALPPGELHRLGRDLLLLRQWASHW